MLSFFGVIHIVHTQKGEGKLLSQMLTIAYNGGEWLQNYVRLQKKKKKKKSEPQNLKTFFLYKRSYYIAMYYCV